MRRIVRLELLGLVLALLLVLLAGRSEATEAGVELLEDVHDRVERSFYDGDRVDEAWTEDVRERFLRRVRRAPDAAADRAVVNEMLGLLGVSHSQVIPGEIYRDQFRNELAGEETDRFGLELETRPGPEGEPRHHVVEVLPGGPADRAGLRRGDEVCTVDGRDPGDADRLVAVGDRGTGGTIRHFLRGDEPVRLRVRTREDARPVALRLEVAPGSRIEATRESVRVIRRAGRSIGYVRLYHVLHGEVARIVRRALDGPLDGVDGLVLDLRGWGGRPDVLFGILGLLPGSRMPVFDGPVVGLVDEETRSAKEVAAYHLRRRGIPLVGRRTAGAVLGARFFEVGHDEVLVLAVADVRRMTDGELLEGVGVAPDVVVPDDLAWAAGRDAILDAGLATCLEQLEETREPATRGPRLF